MPLVRLNALLLCREEELARLGLSFHAIGSAIVFYVPDGSVRAVLRRTVRPRQTSAPGVVSLGRHDLLYIIEWMAGEVPTPETVEAKLAEAIDALLSAGPCQYAGPHENPEEVATARNDRGRPGTGAQTTDVARIQQAHEPNRPASPVRDAEHGSGVQASGWRQNVIGWADQRLRHW